MSDKEIRVVIERVLGAASIFRQGGSLRLFLPKKAFRFLNIPREVDEDSSENLTVILIATDRGIIIRPLEDYLADKEMSKTET